MRNAALLVDMLPTTPCVPSAFEVRDTLSELAPLLHNSTIQSEWMLILNNFSKVIQSAFPMLRRYQENVFR